MKNTLRILVIEDDFLIRSCLEEYLESGGHSVLSAESCVEARSVAQQYDPIDAAIIDLTLPDGHGLELGQELLRNRPTMPIIYASGAMIDPSGLSPQERFVSKPYPLEELLQLVETLHKSFHAVPGE